MKFKKIFPFSESSANSGIRPENVFHGSQITGKIYIYQYGRATGRAQILKRGNPSSQDSLKRPGEEILSFFEATVRFRRSSHVAKALGIRKKKKMSRFLPDTKCAVVSQVLPSCLVALTASCLITDPLSRGQLAVTSWTTAVWPLYDRCNVSRLPGAGRCQSSCRYNMLKHTKGLHVTPPCPARHARRSSLLKKIKTNIRRKPKQIVDLSPSLFSLVVFLLASTEGIQPSWGIQAS